MRSLSCGERAIISQDGPEDETDVCRVLNHKRGLVARKAHNCDACDRGCGINPGETYDLVVLLDDRFEIKRYCNHPCGRN